jgi:hypothetical protein
MIQDLISKYKIKRMRYSDKIFDHLFCEYKTFDLAAINNLHNYLCNFRGYYEIFTMFFGFINYIENLINNNKIINPQININYLYNLMDGNFHLLNSRFRQEEKKIKKMNNDIQNMKKDIEKLNLNMRNMKLDYENKINNLKNKLDKIEENLKCPITQSIINYPVITPSGITYERSAITRWSTINHIDPANRRQLSNEQLVNNIAIKNIINVFNKK